MLRELYPEVLSTYNLTSLVFAQLGMIQEAKEEFDGLRKKIASLGTRKGWCGGTIQWMYATNAFIYAKTGEIEQIRKMISEAESSQGTEYVDPIGIAVMYVAAGEVDRGFRMINEGVSHGNPGWLFHWMFWCFEPFRSDERYVTLNRRLGLTR
jgi:hypothetical protein